MMLTARMVGAFVVGGSTELGSPHDERVVEHPSLLEVSNQCRDRLVNILCKRPVRSHVAMRVPVRGLRQEIRLTPSAHEREHVSVEAESARVDFTDAVCESEQIAANNRGVSPWRPVRFADDVMFLIGQPADVEAFHAARSSWSPRARDRSRAVSHSVEI